MAAGQGISTGARGAADSFNKFVEGQDNAAAAAATSRKAEPERKDFWDSFGQSELTRTTSGGGGNSSIGTSAMKKTTSNTPVANPPKKTKEDGWGDDW